MSALINNVENENLQKLDQSDGFAIFSAGAVCYCLELMLFFV